VRQVAVRLGPTAGKPETYTARMKRKIDSPKGKEMITRRFATAEPVFGNLTPQQTTVPLYAARKKEGRWTMETVLSSPQR